jgi:GT2 family glycosyltransferase
MNLTHEAVISNIGFVVIGRNEGQRLINCLDSIAKFIPLVIYVDSASSDNSILEANKRGAKTVALNMSLPFTAARARNTGFEQLIKFYPAIQLVQFIDGDCEVAADWINAAANFLAQHPEVAVVCGRRRERFPERSIYNKLCDIEWNTPIGEAKACGGDALMRAEVFSKLGGYRDSLIAGEEPELCIRIRQAGYKIWRLDHEMTLHDANITNIKQWWKRTQRAGYAYAEGAKLHGAAPELHWVAESKRAWLWGLILPVIAMILFFIKPIIGLIFLFIYPLQMLRLVMKSTHPFKIACAQAFFLILGKFAEMSGQVKFLWNHYHHQQSKLIEYK